MSMVACFRRVPDDKLEELLADPESIVDFLEDEGYADLDIDKAWHGIHFLLTGTAWEGSPPLDFLVRGGRQVGDVDVGYGPARGFTSAEVQGLARALSAIAPDALLARYDHRAMNALDLYPGGRDGWRPR